MLSNWEEKAALDKWTTMGIPRDRDHYLHPVNLEGLQDGAALLQQQLPRWPETNLNVRLVDQFVGYILFCAILGKLYTIICFCWL